MTQKDFTAEIDEILANPIGTTKMDDDLGSLAGWDSMAVVTFMALADEKFGIQLSAKDLAASKTVADLARLCGSEVE